MIENDKSDDEELEEEREEEEKKKKIQKKKKDFVNFEKNRVRLDVLAIPLSGSGKSRELTIILKEQVLNVKLENPVSLLSFVRAFGAQIKALDLSKEKVVAAITLLTEDEKRKLGCYKVQFDLDSLVDFWQTQLDNSLDAITVQEFYRSRREEDETLCNAWVRMNGLVEVLLLTEKCQWQEVRKFLLSVEFSNGWNKKNTELRNDIWNKREKFLTLEDMILELKVSITQTGLREVVSTKVKTLASTSTLSSSGNFKNSNLVEAAKPLEGQLPFSHNKPEALLCKGCNNFGHPRSYCPDQAKEDRMKYYKDFINAVQKDKKKKGRNKNNKPSEKKDNNINKEENKKENSEYFVFSNNLNLDRKFAKVLAIKGKVRGKDVTIGLDTMSEIDAVTETVAKRMSPFVSTKEIKVKGVGDEIVNIEKFVKGRIDVKKLIIEKEFAVMREEQLPCDILLGYGTLIELGFCDGKKIQLMGNNVETCDPVKKHNMHNSSSLIVMCPMKKLLENKLNMAEVSTQDIHDIVGEKQEVEVGELINRGDFPLETESSVEDQKKLLDELGKIVINSDFSEDGKIKLKQILLENKKAFVLELEEGGMTNTPEVHISLNGKEIKHQIKRENYSLEKKNWMQERVNLYVKKKICRKLTQEELLKCKHIANLIGIEIDAPGKKKTRITQDMKDFNDGNIKVKYHLQRPELARHFQGESEWFSTLDQVDAYFQYKFDLESQPLTAFYGPNDNNVYCWIGVTQGWCNAPALIHMNKDKLYAKFSRKELNYTFDDTLLNSVNEEEHLELIDRYLKVVIEGREKLKPDKCKLGKKKVKFDGFIVSKDKWEKDQIAVEPILNYPIPKSKDDLRTFLGMMGRYEGFIESFSQKAAPLYKFLKKDVKWNKSTSVAIKGDCDKLKESLAKETMLHVPDWNKPFHFWVDSGPSEGIAAVVGQVDDGGKFKPIQFFSRRSTPAEHKLWATEMELVGAKYALVEKGRKFTHGKVFLHTDSKSMKDINLARDKLHDTTRKRLINDLLELRNLPDVTIVWHPRNEMNHVDALNRAAEVEESMERKKVSKSCSMEKYEEKKVIVKLFKEEELEDKIALVCRVHTMGFTYLAKATPGNIKEEQRIDPICKYISKYISKVEVENLELSLRKEEELQVLWDSLPDYAKERIKSYKDVDSNFKKFRIDKDGLLLYIEKDEKITIVVPYVLKARILEAYHDSFLIGHRGVDAVMNALRKNFYWIGRSKDVRKYIKSCKKCAMTKSVKESWKGLKPIEKGRTMDKINMDFVGPLPEAKTGEKYLLVMVCANSGSVKLVATKTKSGEEVAKAFIDKIICAGHLPSVLQTDNAIEFTKGLVNAVNKELGIKGIQGNPYSPQVNGIVERRNGTIGNYLRMFSNSENDNWPEILPFIERTFEVSINPSIGMSPYFYKYGYDSLDILFRAYATDEVDKKNKENESFINWMERMERIREIAGEGVTKYQGKMKQYFDKHKKNHDIKEGDKIYAYYPRQNKLDVFWNGPYEVIKVTDDKRSVITKHVDWEGDLVKFHIDRVIKKSDLPIEVLNDQKMLMWRNAMKKQAITSRKDREAFGREENKGSEIENKRRMEDDRYEVEEIVNHRDRKVTVKKGKKKEVIEIREYLVKWKDYGPNWNTWEDEEDVLDGAEKAVVEYLTKHKVDTKSIRKRKK